MIYLYVHIQVCIKKIFNITGICIFNGNEAFLSLREFKFTVLNAVNGPRLGSKSWMLRYQTLMKRQLLKVALLCLPIVFSHSLEGSLTFCRVGNCFALYFYLFRACIYLPFFLSGKKTWKSSRALFLTSPNGDVLQTQTQQIWIVSVLMAAFASIWL